MIFFRKKLGISHKRTREITKNIYILFIVKGLSIGISLLLIPLTINYINTESYGVWLTISSIVAWMSFFDIGLSNGLRNNFTKAKASGNTELAQKYVSTTYAILSLIFIPLLIVFILINNQINWNELLNIKNNSNNLSLVINIVFSFFCLKFILSTINIILIADQRPSESSIRGLIEQIISLVIIYILTKTTKGSLLNLSVALCITPIVIFLIYNIVFFKKRYKNISPKFSKIDFSLSNDLFGLGFKFFIIQIAGIIQFQTVNFIILKFYSAIDVTNYNITFKYFNVLFMLMGIMLTPIWSAVTDAYTKGEISWIINIANKYKNIIYVFFIIGLFMLLLSSHMYEFWLGKGVVKIPFELSLLMFVYTITLMYGSLYVNILNGIGTIRLQFYLCILSPFIFLLSCFLFKEYSKFGTSGIIISSIIANFNGYLFAPLQFKNIFLKNKKGIWVK